MNFQEITKELLAGKKIRRTCWQEGHYWEIQGKNLINSIGENPLINSSQLKAEDWELYEEEFCLSKKIKYDFDFNYYLAKDVKEFIRLLKEKIIINYPFFYNSTLNSLIDKLAGDKLIK